MTEMDDKARDTVDQESDSRFKIIDLLIILLCLAGAVFLVNLFRLDLFSTLNSKNEKPVGTIIVKNNIVQRRLASRVLWNRLIVDSPAYMGDLIRTANLSSATLLIEGSSEGSTSLDLDERTLIRIQRSPDGEGFQINLGEGKLSLSTGADGGGIVLSLNGYEVNVRPGTTLSASAVKDGITVQVNEGSAAFMPAAIMPAAIINGEQEREIATGEMVSLDADGKERKEKAAVAIQPRPNARYLKNKPEPLPINFIWNRINLDPGEPLRLEIAEDRNFNRIIRVIENLDAAAADAALDTGLWYWRLSSLETDASYRVLSTERFTVTEAAGPTLLSPVTDSLFRYQNNLPQVRFQWSKIDEASSYILELSERADFTSPQIHEQTAAVFLLDSGLGQGTWHWRVMPIFPSVYEGNAAFSPAASFRIEQSDFETGLILPVPVIEQPTLVVAQPTPPRQQGPQQLQITPISLLPAPLNLWPSGGHRIGIEELRTQAGIVFSWAAVQGANAYIFTFYQQTANGRRRIIQRPPENRTSWTMEELHTLDSGTFVWHLEAVNRGPSGTIEQRGNIGEGSFVINIPRPRLIQIEDHGTLYGY